MSQYNSQTTQNHAHDFLCNADECTQVVTYTRNTILNRGISDDVSNQEKGQSDSSSIDAKIDEKQIRTESFESSAAIFSPARLFNICLS